MDRFQMFSSMLKDLGTPLVPGMKILDLGCGDGRLIKAALDRGYDAYGVDFLDDSYAPDTAVLRYLMNKNRVRPIQADPYRLPFPGGYFDAVFSDTVMEHVLDYPATLAELRRVMKPAAVSIHAFPSKLRPIEPHVHIPLGTVFHPRWWLALWANLGVRNNWQRGCDPKTALAKSERFFETRVNYLSGREIRREFGAHFAEVHFAERAALRHSRRARFLPAALYRTFWARYVYTVGVRSVAA